MAPISLQLKHQFQLWLQSQKYQENTVRNYLADINRYFAYLEDLPHSQTNPFSTTAISSYISSISADSNTRRYLASLNKFCQFGLDQRLITANPVRGIVNSTHILSATANLDQLLQQYSLSLQSHKTPTTIKNYINDIKQFIRWSELNPPLTPPLTGRGNVISKNVVNHPPLSRGGQEEGFES